MYEVIYKAFGDGAAKLVKNGLAFTVMTLTIIGLCGGIYYILLFHRAEESDWRHQMKDLEIRMQEKINLVESRYYECQNENRILSIRIAELEAAIKYRLRN
jgi:hypothetical protein